MPQNPAPEAEASNINDRIFQRRQVIDYWNQRVELNKSRWNPKLRAKFDLSLKSIDEAIQLSMDQLSRNPHDEISEQALNVSLEYKLNLLKEFSDL